LKTQQVIFVIGPTAVGKSAYAIDLALEMNGEIVSADSMQVYKGLDLGTAKPTHEERRSVTHHMIDICDPKDDYTAAEYSRAAQDVISDIFVRGKLPVVCGGSGLYVHSLLYDLDFSGSGGNYKLREQLTLEAETHGAGHLFGKLLELDPTAADHIHPNNVKRVIRALERAYGDLESDGLRDFSGTFEKKRRYDARIIRLTMNREELYAKINRRAGDFFTSGLTGEVRDLLENGVPREANSMQGIGYKEVVAFIDGIIDEAEALRLVRQNTRRFAKRQETWFKRYTDAEIIVNEAVKS